MMKPLSKRNTPLPHSHWKLKWGWRQHQTAARLKRPSDDYDTQEFRNTSFPDAITF